MLAHPDAVEEVEAGAQSVVERRLRDGTSERLELGAQGLGAQAFAVLPVDVHEESVPEVEGDGLQHAASVPNAAAGLRRASPSGRAAPGFRMRRSRSARQSPAWAGSLARITSGAATVDYHDRQVDAAAARAHQRPRVARLAVWGAEPVPALAAPIRPCVAWASFRPLPS